jgi:putative ABC transport system permease protein
MTVFAGVRRGLASLRIAGRDVRKQPRDGLLVASLVALPVAVVMAVGLVVASGVPTSGELVAAELGQADAWVQFVTSPGTPVSQENPADPWSFDYSGGDDAPPDAAPSSALLDGARLLPLTSGTALVATDDAAARLPVIVGEAWDPVLNGRY